MNEAASIPSRKKAGSLAQQVVDILQYRIIAGSLTCGEKLPTEAQLMQDLEVSRTVIREAISRLQAAGMVETRHGIGTFVRQYEQASPYASPTGPISPTTIRDIIAMMELRVGLETEAASLAALRRGAQHIVGMQEAVTRFAQMLEQQTTAVEADMDFHLEVARATGNSYFEEIYRSLGLATVPRTRIDTTRFQVESGEPYLVAVNREHGIIMQAIIRQDPSCARSAMHMHLTNSIERLRGVLTQMEAKNMR